MVNGSYHGWNDWQPSVPIAVVNPLLDSFLIITWTYTFIQHSPRGTNSRALPEGYPFFCRNWSSHPYLGRCMLVSRSGSGDHRCQQLSVASMVIVKHHQGLFTLELRFHWCSLTISLQNAGWRWSVRILVTVRDDHPYLVRVKSQIAIINHCWWWSPLPLNPCR